MRACVCLLMQRAIVAGGGVKVIVGAMRTHAGVSGVVKWGCKALEKLADVAANVKLGVDARWLQDAIAAGGGVEVIVAALRTHATVLDVVQYGCLGLGSLAYKHAGNQVGVGGKAQRQKNLSQGFKSFVCLGSCLLSLSFSSCVCVCVCGGADSHRCERRGGDHRRRDAHPCRREGRRAGGMFGISPLG
jgi:hypothetical protein